MELISNTWERVNPVSVKREREEREDGDGSMRFRDCFSVVITSGDGEVSLECGVFEGTEKLRKVIEETVSRCTVTIFKTSEVKES